MHAIGREKTCRSSVTCANMHPGWILNADQCVKVCKLLASATPCSWMKNRTKINTIYWSVSNAQDAFVAEWKVARRSETNNSDRENTKSFHCGTVLVVSDLHRQNMCIGTVQEELSGSKVSAADKSEGWDDARYSPCKTHFWLSVNSSVEW